MGLGCVFVLGRRFLVRNGLGRVRIRNGGMDVLLRRRVYGLVRVVRVRIMECRHLEGGDLETDVMIPRTLEINVRIDLIRKDRH